MSEPSSEGWPSGIIQRLWSQRHSVDGFCWCVLVGWVGWFGVRGGGYVNILTTYDIYVLWFSVGMHLERFLNLCLFCSCC